MEFSFFLLENQWCILKVVIAIRFALTFIKQIEAEGDYTFVVLDSVLERSTTKSLVSDFI